MDPKKVAVKESEAQRKKYSNYNDLDRLKEFRQDTLYNAIFICCCCHRRLFLENVEVIDSKLISMLNEAKEGLFAK